MIALFDLATLRYGGFLSYTVHLYRTLKARGHDVGIFKVAGRTERFTRPYIDGTEYQNVSMADAVAITRAGTGHIACVYRKGPAWDVAIDLAKAGATVTWHDPQDSRGDAVQELDFAGARNIVIRRAMADQTGGTFIPHPYVRYDVPALPGMPHRNAVNMSRLDFDKHTEIVAAANDILQPDQRIELVGAENRMFTHHKLDPEYPGWRRAYSGPYPREHGASVQMARTARWVVDLSVIKGDGGGTQYTFLEAWDAGTPLIVHADWLRDDDPTMENGRNCLAVSTARQLASTIGHGWDGNAMFARNGQAQLDRDHAPDVVGPQYERFWGIA